MDKDQVNVRGSRVLVGLTGHTWIGHLTELRDYSGSLQYYSLIPVKHYSVLDRVNEVFVNRRTLFKGLGI